MRFLFLPLFIFSSFLYASEEPYLISISRNGVSQSMVAYNFLSGEYPKPVIVVNSKSGWNKINGHLSLRKLAKKKACTIRSGVYHPWSNDKTSLISFYSIRPRTSHIAMSNTEIEDQKVEKEDKFINEVYLSEGFCSYSLNGRKRVDINCIRDNKNFKTIEYPAHPSEQWLYLDCKEGYKVFVQDSELLTQSNITEGQITGYGKVAK